jgi:ATP/ADP translocase
VPTVVATILILMREMIYNWLVRIVQRRHIVTLRKKKKKKTRQQKIKLKV